MHSAKLVLKLHIISFIHILLLQPMQHFIKYRLFLKTTVYFPPLYINLDAYKIMQKESFQATTKLIMYLLNNIINEI